MIQVIAGGGYHSLVMVTLAYNFLLLLVGAALLRLQIKRGNGKTALTTIVGSGLASLVLAALLGEMTT